MSGGPLSDPRVRRAYLMSKAGILLVALVLTWPLSKVLGDQAWVVFIVFAVAMAAMTLVILGLGSRSRGRTEAAVPTLEDEMAPEDDEEALDPDDVMQVPIEDALDLHSFPPRDVPKVVESYLEEALERGMREVRLIHGRGKGVQRTRVQSLLSRHPAVAGFHDAPPDRGGWGATVVYLLPPDQH